MQSRSGHRKSKAGPARGELFGLGPGSTSRFSPGHGEAVVIMFEEASPHQLDELVITIFTESQL